MDELEWLNTSFERREKQKALTENLYKDFLKCWEGFITSLGCKLCVVTHDGTLLPAEPFLIKQRKGWEEWKIKTECERIARDLIPLDPDKPCKINI